MAAGRGADNNGVLQTQPQPAAPMNTWLSHNGRALQEEKPDVGTLEREEAGVVKCSWWPRTDGLGQNSSGNFSSSKTAQGGGGGWMELTETEQESKHPRTFSVTFL